jgi:hypothetical protein
MAGVQWGSVGEWVAGLGTVSAVWFAARLSSRERERADLKQESDGLDACSEWLAKLWTRLTRGETVAVANEDYGASVVRAMVDHPPDVLDDDDTAFLMGWFTGAQEWKLDDRESIARIRRNIEARRSMLESRRLARPDYLRLPRAIVRLPRTLIARARRAAGGT